MTIQQLTAGLEPVAVRRAPGLVLDALRLVHRASPGLLLASVGLTVVQGVGLGAQLVLGQRALHALLHAHQAGRLTADVVLMVVAVALVTAMLTAGSAAQRDCEHVLGQHVARHVEGRVLDVTGDADVLAFDRPQFHDRVQRVQLAQTQPLAIVYGLVTTLAAVTGLLGVGVALASTAPVLLLCLGFAPMPAVWAASRRGRALFRLSWDLTARDRERHYLADLLSSREAAAEVRAFALTPFLRARYDALYQQRLAAVGRVARQEAGRSLAAGLAIGAVVGTLLVLLAWLAATGRVQLAEAGVALAGLALVGSRMTAAGFAIGGLTEAGLYLNDWLDLLRQSRATANARATGRAPAGFRQVRVDRVRFTYPSATRPAVDGVSLSINHGEVVALVGENGSGKTTLAKLLAHLYHPDEGTIAWDGTDMATVDPAAARRAVAVVLQDFLKYHLPVRDIIRLGRQDRAGTTGAVADAARQAGAHAFIERLPQGYATLLGPQFIGGTDLSVGQWQRMALARAFFRDAPFVILDEPTASLDARAEADLFHRIRLLLAGRTVLLISHRLASVRMADRIYVLHQGRIVEGGSHDELMVARGRYFDLFTRQAAAYLPAPHGPAATP